MIITDSEISNEYRKIIGDRGNKYTTPILMMENWSEITHYFFQNFGVKRTSTV